MKWWMWILAIIALIGIGMLIPGVRNVIKAPADMVEAVSTGMEIKQIEAMIKGFEKKLKRWPTEEEFQELIAESYPPDRTDSLRSNQMVDIWGEPYNYFRQGSGFVVTSMGPDKKPGTTDDIILLRRN